MRNTVLIAEALIVAVGCGWLWGASGRWTAERAMHALEVRQDLVEGRSALLDARIAVYSVNFGDASRHLENARRDEAVMWRAASAPSASPAAPASLHALVAHVFASRLAHPFVNPLLRQRLPMTLARRVDGSATQARRSGWCLFRRCVRLVFLPGLTRHGFLHVSHPTL
jgi:hypothetical protein